MSIVQALLPEFDSEMAITRPLLERVPEDRADWKPHPRSTALGALAAHISNLVSFGTRVLADTEMDMNPPGGVPFRAPGFTTRDALLADFDCGAERTRAALAAATDEELRVTWTLKSGGETFFAMPRGVVLRTMMLNHIVHHRGQLSVYLRLNEVPLPSIYGPSADSKG